MRRSFPFAVRKLSCHSQSSWKSDVILVILLLALPLFAISYGCQGRKVAFYHNDYHGIQPGKTTLKEVISILGPYLEVQETPDGHNYRFQKVVVNFSGSNRSVVNTLTIDRDRGYTSPRGIRLGDPVSCLDQFRHNGRYVPTAVFDATHGVFYWNDGEVVTLIALVYRVLR